MPLSGIATLATGSELLDGRVLDTNSNFVAEKLAEQGLQLSHILSCGDSIKDIKDALTFLLERASIVIVSGGLGPTADDLTREAIAEVVKKKLVLDEHVLENLKALFEKRKRLFDPSNEKQALFPEGSTVIPNPIGTAAGFIATKQSPQGEQYILSVPGVPKELRLMCAETVFPFVFAKMPKSIAWRERPARLFGLSEAAIGEVIVSLGLPPEISVSYRATFPEIQVKLKTQSPQIDLDAFFEAARKKLGEDYIFSCSLSENLEQSLIRLLRERRQTIAIAEPLSSGIAGSLLALQPEARATYKGGTISKSSESSAAQPSKDVARALAEEVRKEFQSEIGLSITGNSEFQAVEKQGLTPGTIYIGLSDGKTSQGFEFFHGSSREHTLRYSAYIALDTVRRHLLGLPIRSK